MRLALISLEVELRVGVICRADLASDDSPSYEGSNNIYGSHAVRVLEISFFFLL